MQAVLPVNTITIQIHIFCTRQLLDLGWHQPRARPSQSNSNLDELFLVSKMSQSLSDHAFFFCQKFTPFPVPVSTRAVLGISEGHRVTFKSRLNPPVPPDFGTKDDTALVVTRCGALVPPPDQPPTKTKATRVQGLRF